MHRMTFYLQTFQATSSNYADNKKNSKQAIRLSAVIQSHNFHSLSQDFVLPILLVLTTKIEVTMCNSIVDYRQLRLDFLLKFCFCGGKYTTFYSYKIKIFQTFLSNIANYIKNKPYKALQQGYKLLYTYYKYNTNCKHPLHNRYRNQKNLAFLVM